MSQVSGRASPSSPSNLTARNGSLSHCCCLRLSSYTCKCALLNVHSIWHVYTVPPSLKFIWSFGTIPEPRNACSSPCQRGFFLPSLTILFLNDTITFKLAKGDAINNWPSQTFAKKINSRWLPTILCSRVGPRWWTDDKSETEKQMFGEFRKVFGFAELRSRLSKKLRSRSF